MASWSSEARSASLKFGGEVRPAVDRGVASQELSVTLGLEQGRTVDSMLPSWLHPVFEVRRTGDSTVTSWPHPKFEARTGDRPVALWPHPTPESPPAPHACLVDGDGVPPSHLVAGAASGKHGEPPGLSTERKRRSTGIGPAFAAEAGSAE